MINGYFFILETNKRQSSMNPIKHTEKMPLPSQLIKALQLSVKLQDSQGHCYVGALTYSKSASDT